jgi:hypothetical protein
MGTWGTGLYSDDDALDLRSTISAVCRLPLEAERLVELLEELNPSSRDPTDEGYSTFWLVLADQFHNRGIRSTATERAIAIIASGSDLAMLARLGMSDSDLRQRKAVLAKLACKLASTKTKAHRNVLRRPQPLLFRAGDVLAFPVDRQGNCSNPYMSEAGESRFEPVGWDACLVVSSGLALDYLAWYEVATTTGPWASRPSVHQVMGDLSPHRSTGVGTMSKCHVARMRLELLGRVPAWNSEPPSQDYLISTTAGAISIANVLSRWRAIDMFR